MHTAAQLAAAPDCSASRVDRMYKGESVSACERDSCFDDEDARAHLRARTGTTLVLRASAALPWPGESPPESTAPSSLTKPSCCRHLNQLNLSVRESVS